ncbi:N-6 DNA methylase [Haloplanus salinus]|nr:N-6 DNA methylase [Haloplanus salinus]
MSVASFSGDEDAYQKPLDRYRNDGRDEETIRALATLHANALGGLVLAVEETQEDVLGGVYEHYGLTSEHFAQYFTPGAVSRAMAQMNLPDANSIREATPEEPLVIGDVSGCGSGRLIVDSARRLRDLAPEAPAVYLGYDKDPLCAKMAVLNFVLNDMTGYVLLGDALKLDAHRVWFISTAQLIGGDHPVRELDTSEGDRVLARFFGAPHVDNDAGASQEEPDTESELDVDPEPTPGEPTPAPNLDVTLDPSETSQAGFDEFA